MTQTVVTSQGNKQVGAKDAIRPSPKVNVPKFRLISITPFTREEVMRYA
ncbi:MAG TPA: hypothetical protein VIX19_00450 [Terriglobales bacterium]